MLLEFAVSNYKCFSDEIIFKMTPAPKIQDLKYSVLSVRNSDNIKSLSAAVIYGPNASGKTNFIGAIDTLKSIIKRGHIRNADMNDRDPNFAKNNLELIPYYKNNFAKPVKFRIKFWKQETYEYTLILYLGKFLETSAERKILQEKLVVNDKLIYNVTNQNEKQLTVDNIDSISNYFINDFNKDISYDYSKNNFIDDELFLTTKFKNLYSSRLTEQFLNWFDEDLMTIYSSNVVKSTPIWEEKDDTNTLLIDKDLNEATRIFGLSADMIVFGQLDNQDETQTLSVINKGKKNETAIRTGAFESYGTVRFINIFPLLREAIQYGKTLIIDEFDASVHPMAIMSIVNVFHNDEINKKGAQLIFNTHNPVFLNRNTFRRDEIKFVEKDEEKGTSIHYSLSDFGTSGVGSVRNTENYMEKYFISKYGAIKNVDFSPVFEAIMQENDNDEED